jgi:hypothetical protein
VKGLASILRLLEVLVALREALTCGNLKTSVHFGFEIQTVPMPKRQFEISTKVDSKKGYTGSNKEEKTKQ